VIEQLEQIVPVTAAQSIPVNVPTHTVMFMEDCEA
jgi:hypothetical protein